MKRKTREPGKQKVFTIGNILPSLVTLLSAAFALTAVLYASQGYFGRAVALIALAALCDGVDGRLARAFKTNSQFGVELDSLVDNVSFGVAPAFITFFWATNGVKGIGWAASIIFAACMTLRLARFNVMTGDSKVPEYWHHFFTGVPAPAGGLMALLPIAFFNVTGFEIFTSPALCLAFVAGTAFLLISRVPTLSLKKIHVAKEFAPLVLVSLFIIFLLALQYFWITLSVAGVVYILSIPFTCVKFLRMKRAYNEAR
jgi:CDP-diacylglycerol--serine O-phosphatidyltransferase